MAEAIQLLEGVYDASKSFGGAPLGYAYARSGRRADALRVLDEMSKDAALPAQEKAIVFLGLDDKERTFLMLQQACDDHHATFPFCLHRTSVRWAPLRTQIRRLAQCAHMAL